MTRLTALLAVFFVATLGLIGGSATAGGDHPEKVFVCKYVGTPGVDERLQTGQNPISVSVNAIPGGASVGAFFADAQGRSFVLAFDTGQPEPSVDNCPQPETPPTDVCPNIEGNQATVPAGMVKDANGNCVTPPPPPPPPSPPFVCPDGGPPNEGKDGDVPSSGNTNDDCDRSVKPPVKSTPPTVTPPVVTPPVVTPPAVTPPAASPPKAKPPVKKATSKVKPPIKKKTAVVKKKGPHVCVPLKDGTERAWWKGGNGMPAGCYAIIRGSG